VFSLSRLNRISDEGVEFRSPIDGSRNFFSPELTVEIQEALGSDIAMVFDECAPPGSDYEYVKKSVSRTYEWAKRFYRKHSLETQLVFGIVQGGFWEELRNESVKQITSIQVDPNSG